MVADDAAQAAGHRAQQLVADTVTEAVVDDLEVVEVDEQHRHLTTAAPRRAVRSAGVISDDRFGSPVSSSWLAANVSCSAVRLCSVTSSMWVIASIVPSSSVSDTRVRAHTNSPSLRR